MADPFAAPAPPAAPAEALPCAHCRRPMLPLALQGHYGRDVGVQLCEPCRLLWFDTVEAVTLTGRAWLVLLQRLRAAPAAAAPWRGGPAGCPACGAALRPGPALLPAFGGPAALDCGAGHGRLQRVGQLLAERGLAKPLAAAPRAGRGCVNCGAPLARDGEGCGRCASPLAVFDGPALAAALRPRPAAPLPPAAGPVDALPTWPALAPLLAACEAEWWAQQQAPRPRVWTNQLPPENTESWRTTSLARLFGRLGQQGTARRVVLLIVALLVLGWLLRRR